MHTPWGKADRVRAYLPGVLEVSTPSHGGIMVSEAAAKKHLSEAARECGFRFGGYLCFEEDCEWQIVAWEMPDLWPEMFKHSPALAADPKAYLLRALSSWQADYLQALGVTPDPEGYAFWLEKKQSAEMRAAKHPDLIVSARGSWHTKVPGVFEVTTADGASHLVDATSYDRERQAHSLMPLVSRCMLATR